MRSAAAALCVMWAAMATLRGVVALGNGGGISDNHFIDDYFYDDDAISLVTASTSIPSDFLGESVVLAVEQASVYKEFMLHASRTQDVVVFMSTSPDARQVFERAVRRLDDDALSTTRFFALPLPPPSSSPPDDDGAGFDEPIVSFHSVHSLPSIPKSGLHVVVTYPASGPRSLAVHASNAKMVQASTSEDDWVARLQSQLASFTATPAPPSSPSSVMPSMMTVAIVLYVGVAVIPKVAANWQWWVTFCQSKRIWFGLSLFGLYLSLSGTPQQIFVDVLIMWVMVCLSGWLALRRLILLNHPWRPSVPLVWPRLCPHASTAPTAVCPGRFVWRDVAVRRLRRAAHHHPRHAVPTQPRPPIPLGRHVCHGPRHHMLPRACALHVQKSVVSVVLVEGTFATPW
ncbi:hypothetical protein H257_04042 [Aphanomyces astaci]|uniref:Uncharacterized protein n=1 Tax=Aphanomyces astaci TaxID=112090 RepID=W4GUB3_APHAT|nr:hypothetical protein H257_04042 [Aphanomyces astaci]ETV83277.1 hypothetical protein H257_04042 [Aphanomyces astaci]|eukprot:XP_009826707.1 hypothetical protein H257_04042 [Aphanomyces astaci]